MATVKEAGHRTRSPMFLRAATASVSVLLLAQTALAGGFLSGNFEALSAHAMIGGAVAAALLVQLVAAVTAWRTRRTAFQPVATSVVQLVIAAVLIVLGNERVLWVHVPLAVGLTVGSALLVVSSWRG